MMSHLAGHLRYRHTQATPWTHRACSTQGPGKECKQKPIALSEIIPTPGRLLYLFPYFVFFFWVTLRHSPASYERSKVNHLRTPQIKTSSTSYCPSIFVRHGREEALVESISALDQVVMLAHPGDHISKSTSQVPWIVYELSQRCSEALLLGIVVAAAMIDQWTTSICTPRRQPFANLNCKFWAAPGTRCTKQFPASFLQFSSKSPKSCHQFLFCAVKRVPFRTARNLARQHHIKWCPNCWFLKSNQGIWCDDFWHVFTFWQGNFGRKWSYHVMDASCSIHWVALESPGNSVNARAGVNFS